MEQGCQKLKDYHIWQSSNVKLFVVQRRRETAKLLQFLELMKVTFDTRKAAISEYEMS
jgi:hypothetical protein